MLRSKRDIIDNLNRRFISSSVIISFRLRRSLLGELEVDMLKRDTDLLKVSFIGFLKFFHAAMQSRLSGIREMIIEDYSRSDRKTE